MNQAKLLVFSKLEETFSLHLRLSNFGVPLMVVFNFFPYPELPKFIALAVRVMRNATGLYLTEYKDGLRQDDLTLLRMLQQHKRVSATKQLSDLEGMIQILWTQGYLQCDLHGRQE